MSKTDVPVLMLTHIIPAPASAADEQALVDEIHEGGYRGTVIVGEDLDRYRLGTCYILMIDHIVTNVYRVRPGFPERILSCVLLARTLCSIIIRLAVERWSSFG